MTMVTGASGYVGGAVVRSLVPDEVVALVREPTRAPAGIQFRVGDYDDLDSLVKAFEGIRTLIFVPSDGFAEDIARHCENVIEAARISSIRTFVFLSIVDVDEGSPFYYAPVYRRAEVRLRESGMTFVVLRSGLYSDFVLKSLPNAAGEFWVPAGDARIALIYRDDVAAALAAVAREPSGFSGRTFQLTGDRAMTFGEIAAWAGAVFRDCGIEEYTTWLRTVWDAPWPEAFSTLFASIREGRFGGVSNDFEALVGRSPRALDG
ncbi:MAG: NAD(P)H-binding protein [Armatimonadetes bacterium]|nr:NAD(P)H-binding protein [Armatimonadota bacterium]